MLFDPRFAPIQACKTSTTYYNIPALTLSLLVTARLHNTISKGKFYLSQVSVGPFVSQRHPLDQFTNIFGAVCYVYANMIILSDCGLNW
jgi:hypothetical protein